MKTLKTELPKIMRVVIPTTLLILIYMLVPGAEDSKNTSSGTQGALTNAVKNQQISLTNAISASTNAVTNATEEVLAKIPPDFSALGLRPELEEIVKLAQSGVSEEVIIQFINQSTNSYNNLTSQEIITLNDLGVPSNVIAAMMRKGGKSEQEINKMTEDSIVVSATNETIVATREASSAQQATQAQQPTQTQQPAQTQQVSQPSGQVQVAQIQTQVYTQTVYVPVQTEQPQVVVQQQPVVVQEQIPQTVAVYYNYLSPYGSWLYIDGYGYCWQPTVVVINPGWRPYFHGGRWVWTDYGWYWLSDYSWGWATFHYGRWHYHHSCGWVWVPDTVWAPAWVSWRITPTYCGWAPLPPHAYYHAGIGFVYHGRHVDVHFDFGLSDWHYTFVSWHSFHHRDFYRYALPRDHVRPVYENSTVINNYIIGNNNNVVINTGVGTEHISRLTREEVKKVVVRDIPSQGPKPIYSERLVKDGNNIVLYRPSPQTPLVAKADVQSITPKIMPVKYTAPEKAPVSPTKLTPLATPVNRLASEPAKPNVPVSSISGKPGEKSQGKEIAVPSRTPAPGQQKTIEPIKPTAGIAKTTSLPSAPIRPQQPGIISGDNKQIIATRTPEVAKAEIPKTITPVTPSSATTKEIPTKDTTISKPVGAKPQPILPNNGLTAGTYGAAKLNPIVTPSIPPTYPPQTRMRSPVDPSGSVTPQRIPDSGLAPRGNPGVSPNNPQGAPVNRIQPLPTPSTPQLRESGFRAPVVHPVTPQPMKPVNPPSNPKGATEIQPGGVKFTPLPTPSPSPMPSSSPRPIVSPQAPVRSYVHAPATKYEAPKQSVAPSSPAPQGSSYIPSHSGSYSGRFSSVPPSMPSTPPGYKDSYGKNR